MKKRLETALGCMLALSACSKPTVAVIASQLDVPSNGTVKLAAKVKNLGGDLTYRWMPGRGRCVPQEGKELQTVYYPASVDGEDLVTVEVLLNGYVEASGRISLRIVNGASPMEPTIPQEASSVSVSINRIPRYDAFGGPAETATIAGEVHGMSPQHRVVLYSFTDQWYVQPEVARPYTVIDASGRWVAAIHLGSRYAALVVRGDYQPPVRTGALPRPGDDVVAVAEVEGRR